MMDTLQQIREVKKKYEREWLALPGVAGVGIGPVANGEIGIIISVSEHPEKVREKISERINSVAIEIRETGDFRAQ